MLNEYSIDYRPSHIRNALFRGHFLKKASPFVLVGLIGFTFWFIQMVVGIAAVPVSVNILH